MTRIYLVHCNMWLYLYIWVHVAQIIAYRYIIDIGDMCTYYVYASLDQYFLCPTQYMLSKVESSSSKVRVRTEEELEQSNKDPERLE
jgi:hypothetical protein